MVWSDWILENELLIRLSIFFGIFSLMASWEVIAPKRPLKIARRNRWPSNIGIVILNSVALRIIFPTAAVGVAYYAQSEGWGVFNSLSLPYATSVVISVVLFDFIIYLQHLTFHASPILWRLHQVHHADQDYDVTTGARFHTLEILLSMLIKCSAILLLGPPVVAIIIFEVLLNATAMFNHSNIALPKKLDRILRLIIVTPDMHRIHHSNIVKETNSNFGFNLSWWDQLFGTYTKQPSLGYDNMEIGLKGIEDQKQTNHILGMLGMPFSNNRKS